VGATHASCGFKRPPNPNAATRELLSEAARLADSVDPVQADAALNTRIARFKGIETPEGNVLVFPSSGRIGFDPKPAGARQLCADRVVPFQA